MFIVYIFVLIVFIIYEMFKKCKNRKFYKLNKLICRLLIFVCKYGGIYNLLNFVIYYNVICRYKEFIKKIDILRLKFLKFYVFYWGKNEERYNEVVVGWFFLKWMKEVWIVECSFFY